ncbi:3-hydroxy-fatty acyl-ACP dehydratase [Jejubacter calystegiae]|uniref:3-hydroxy-fatty acyl-ACP dehydratase n=1 Tax=Jejubacter calystegiae TaxID=2579935 RepID=A0A4P8YJM4_9ENTR|nr:3-hydroxy-fatty acyl-ACP dehydratase [Jejubacter calystegiae]QCT20919.1 3-hydroxy-fatty acyl-ACP dehydratase [Jejubacter calystegiae]
MNHFKTPESYLPHEAPMCLLEQVVAVSEQGAHCRVTVTPDGVLAPFLTPDGALPGWFAIELMAQTVGVWNGWYDPDNQRIGMLLGGRELCCEPGRFSAGMVLDCHVQMLMRDDKVGSFEGRICCQGIQLASGRINTWQPDDEQLQQLIGEKG